MKRNLLIAASAAMVLGVSASAQTSPGTSNMSKGPEASSTLGKYSNYDRLAVSQRGGISFTGKVGIDGGALPWDAIPVSVTCDGTPRYNTVADAKGAFIISGARQSSEIVPEKSDTKQATASQLAGCQVQASLPGYHSSIITILNGNILDNPDIGTVTLHLDEHATGTAMSATTLSAPKDAVKKFDKARAEWLDRNPDGAQHDLEKAVQIGPQFAEAWYQLGKLQEKTKPQDALNSYQKAAAADPQFVSPYEPIASLSAQQQKWQLVVDATSHSLKLDPSGTPQIWYFDAVGNFNLGNKDLAEASAKKSLAMDPQHLAPNTEQLLAVILAGRGDYVQALEHLRSCLTYTPSGPNADLMKQQIAQLEKVVPAGK